MELLFKRCNKCGENLFFEIEIFGQKRIVGRKCKCEREEYERRKQEEENREKQIRLNQLRQYSMMDAHFEQCRFENFRIDKDNEKLYRLGIKYCERWPEMKAKNVGFLFYGPPGTGKTYLAFCIANRLMEQLVPVIAISSIGLLNRIKQTYNSYGQEGEVELINSLRNASLLILDDLGAEDNRGWAREKIYEIIDSRYRDGKPMICTTNLTKEQLKAKLAGPDGVDRTYDRLIEMCYPIQVRGTSRRAKAAAEKAKIIEELI